MNFLRTEILNLHITKKDANSFAGNAEYLVCAPKIDANGFAGNAEYLVCAPKIDADSFAGKSEYPICALRIDANSFAGKSEYPICALRIDDFVDRLLACGASKSVSKMDHRKFQMLHFET